MSNDRIERDNPIIKALHKVKPAAVHVFERGKSEPRNVHLSKGRNRWRALLDTLDALAWERIEALDETGATLALIEPEDESTALVAAPGNPPDRVDDVRDLVALMREVQRDTLREAREIYSSQADATARVLDSVSESMRTMREAYEMALRLQAAQAAGGASPNESEGIAQLLQMAALMGQGPRLVPQPKPAPAPAPPKVG